MAKQLILAQSKRNREKWMDTLIHLVYRKTK